MLTDHSNRLWLVICLAFSAFFMLLMALAALGHPLDGGLGIALAMLVWPLVLAVVIPGIFWLGNAPIVQRLCNSDRVAVQALGLFLFVSGLCTGVTAFITVWLTTSSAIYALTAASCGLVAEHQRRILAAETLFVSGSRVFASARLVQ